jgi:CheY-like chemotaxis protein
MAQTQNDSSVPTILIVEDDESTGDVMVTAIGQETAYVTRLAKTGHEALQVVQKHKPGLFILDYRLPDISGVELYDRLHAIQDLAEIPTILMSAGKLDEALEQRNVVFLNKPFELDEFLTAVKRLLL